MDEMDRLRRELEMSAEPTMADAVELLAAKSVEIKMLRTALAEISSALASGFQIVQREGIHDTPGTTSWNLAADRFSELLHKHHAVITSARQATGILS